MNTKQSNWMSTGKVLFLGDIDINGKPYRRPICPFHDNYWDNKLVSWFLRDGKCPIVVDFGREFNIPSIYNDVPNIGDQLKLF